MRKMYFTMVGTVAVVMLIVRLAVKADPTAHGSWQIMLQNLILAPGVILLFPLLLLTGGESSVLATFLGIVAFGVSAAVYALPLFVIVKWLDKKNSKSAK